MKKLSVIFVLMFVFGVLVTKNTYAQAQEPVKKETVKSNCGGHDHKHDAAKCASKDAAKSDEAPKSGCANATTKCPSTCPHAKAAATKEAQPANSEKKRTPVPQN